MPNYNIPSIPTTPMGPLSGYYRGLQHDLALEDADRTFRDSDLKHLSNLNKYDNEMLDNPLKEEERAKKIADAIYEQELINSGAKRDAFDTANTSVKVNTDSQRLSNAQKQVDQASDMLNSFSALPPLVQQAQWNEFGTKARSLGVKMPEGSWSTENALKVKAMAEASLQTRDQLNKLTNKQIEFGYDMAKQERKGDLDMALERQRGITSTANTRTLAEARGETANTDPYKAAVKALQAKADAGIPVSFAEIDALAAATEKQDSKQLESIKESVRSDLMVARTSSEKFDTWLVANGFTPEDKKKDSSFLVNTVAKREYDAARFEEAYKTAKAPKMTSADVEKVAKLNPGLADVIRKTGRVIARPTGSTSGVSKPAPGEFQGDWNASVKATADKLKISVAEAEARFRKQGYYPKGEATKAAATAPVVTEDPVDHDLNAYLGR